VRLLSKTQIAVDTSLAKKKLIDEGLSVARKIDKMREEMLNLQKQQREFIEGTKSAIEKETKGVSEALEHLKTEVSMLVAEREKLKEPLDKEWTQLKEVQKKLSEDQGIFKQHQQDLSATKILSDAREVALDGKDKRLNLTQAEFERILQEAKDEKLHADSILSAARGKQEVMDKMIESRLDEVIVRENTVEFNRQGLEQITKNQEMKEKELVDRERAVTDKYNQLLKTQENVKHTKG
jgi:chromosome segregation ATPase